MSRKTSVGDKVDMTHRDYAARLAAAAPDLYAALQMVCDSGAPLADEIEAAMLAALAKVDGAAEREPSQEG